MPGEADAVFGAEDFATAFPVSRETLDALKIYVAMLEDESTRFNLVSRASLADVWRRHVWDSAQLAALIPDKARSIADLGSGAGFPGLVLAILLRERAGLRVVLFEATGKKARFLQSVAERLNLPVDVRAVRMEDVKREVFDVVTARACAPLERLLAYAQRFWGANTIGLFLKGQNVDAELTEAGKSWRMNLRRQPSATDGSGAVLIIRDLHPQESHRARSG
jgi:16S rRNA (guanine527-N7)-methyltransferase